MDVTRRGLIGMFAADVAAAAIPSGVFMPVKSIPAWDDLIREVESYDVKRDVDMHRLDLWLCKDGRQTQMCISVEIPSEWGFDRRSKAIREARQLMIEAAQRDGFRPHNALRLPPHLVI